MEKVSFITAAQFVTDFYQANPVIEKKLTEIFGSKFMMEMHYDIIKGISDNKTMFSKYSNGKFDKCYNFYQALAITNATPNAALTYFTDLKLYAVVKSIDDGLETFAGKVRDMIDDGERVNINQIILTNQKQKMVFICSGDSEPTVEKLQKYVHDYLHNETSVVKLDGKVQITVESTMYDSYEQAFNKFINLQDHIRDHDDQLAQIISAMPRMREQPHSYILSAIQLSGITKEELAAGLKTPINIVIVNGNVNGNIINGNNNGVQQPDNRAITKNWVHDNPPAMHEITTDYYDRYTTAIEHAVPNNQFAKIVREFGYETGQANNKRFWRK